MSWTIKTWKKQDPHYGGFDLLKFLQTPTVELSGAEKPKNIPLPAAKLLWSLSDLRERGGRGGRLSLSCDISEGEDPLQNEFGSAELMRKTGDSEVKSWRLQDFGDTADCVLKTPQVPTHHNCFCPLIVFDFICRCSYFSSEASICSTSCSRNRGCCRHASSG